MNLPPPTVPPPKDDDHEDVAWALRAASAQWKRESLGDAVLWVERAAETAEEVGALGRSIELLQLAASLRRLPKAALGVAPPPAAPPRAPSLPPPFSRQAPPPITSRAAPMAASGGPVIETEEVEVEIDIDDADEVEIDDAVEIEEEAEDPIDPAFLDFLGDAAPRALASTAPKAPAPVESLNHRRPLPSFAPPDDEEPPGPTLPPLPEVRPRSSRPPSGRRDSVAPPGWSGPGWSGPPQDSSRLPELPSRRATEDRSSEPLFGELDLDPPPAEHEEAPPSSTAPVELPSSIHHDKGSLDFDLSSPAEVAMSRGPRPQPEQRLADDEDIEKALGVDLSVRWAPPPVRTVGMASVRPSDRPRSDRARSDRIVSADAEPFAVAPSATLPPFAPIEPPSHPSLAPPPSSMRDPSLDREPYAYPPDADGPIGVVPSAPPEEFPSEGAVELPEFPFAEAPAAPDSIVPSSAIPSSVGPGSVPPSEGPRSSIDGILLSEVPGLQDLPEEVQNELLARATRVKLNPGEEVGSFSVALVTRGTVQLMPAVADASCATVRKGGVIFTQGTVEPTIELRAVGFDLGTRVAVVDKAFFDELISRCPWVIDDLRSVADRYQALAGAMLGPLGDSLDEMFRQIVLDALNVRRVLSGETVTEKGKPVGGLFIVGVGNFDVLGPDGSVISTLSSGDFIFPSVILGGGVAPNTVVARGDGLVLHASRMKAHELLATCPPVIELLAGA